MKTRLGYLATAAATACLIVASVVGCATPPAGDPLDQASHIIKLGDGKLFGVTLPPEIVAQGRGAAETYLAARYPVAAPYVAALVDRVFPARAVSSADSITIPIVWTTNITVRLRDGLEVNGSRFLAGSDVDGIFVTRKPVLGAVALPAEINQQFTPGQFAAQAIDGSPALVVTQAVAETAAPATAAHTNLEAALEDIGGVR